MSLKSSIYYVYPKYKNVSFSVVAREHINQLKKRVIVQEINEEVLENLQWLRQRNILLHPVLYVTIGDRADLFDQRQGRLRNLLRVKGKLGGFETADTNKISRIAIDSLNKLDLVVVPSTFAKQVYEKSGARAPIHILPHGLSDVFINSSRRISNPNLRKIFEKKKASNAVLVLFFMLHSDYRKGADIVYEAMDFLQQKDRHICLVIKKSTCDTDISKKLRRLRAIEVSSWLSQEDLRQLYDLSDMLIVPSRGGGFELNALEGLARGLPTIVPEAGCFLDYIDYCIPMPIEREVQVFPDNPIHVGKGWEVSADTLINKVDFCYNCLDQLKEKARERAKEIRSKYSWNVLGERLYEILSIHGFCGRT